MVGKGYTGGQNVDVNTLELNDQFGTSVSLNAVGNRLAVGAWRDDGADNGTHEAGAVYLFTFTDGAFSGGQLAAVVGKGYTGGRNVDVAALEGNDYFGASVSLNARGDRLAVGAFGDEGADNRTVHAGAVYLFTFTDGDVSGGRLAAVVGKGYTGGQNVDVTTLEGDQFGISVSLNAAGDRLAVGASNDDGADNGTENAGAVYLFVFTDDAFSGGQLAAVVGKGYASSREVDIGDPELDAGGGDVDIAALESGDRFGTSVSLNGSGTRLAVGAGGDDGADNAAAFPGAVYLFTFADDAFSGGRLAAVVGKGYTGGSNVDVAALERNDYFGGSVSLNAAGDRLAVGAPHDAGDGNPSAALGAVYLFTFTDDAFSGGQLAAVLGKGYTGGSNVDVAALELFDLFGISVSLNGSGTRLAVGAREYNIGSGTAKTGAVYLFTFTDDAFSGGRLAAVMGKGYTGGGNVDVAALEASDWFGRSVSLNAAGTRLAVGAYGDDGAGNGTEDAGAVYLFTFTDGDFSGGRLAAVLGKGYTGGGNVDVAALEKWDLFGASASLNAAGDGLAVGAFGDDGAGNGTEDAGAVYLFVFTDGDFSGGQMAAVVGKSYTGGDDVDVAALEKDDAFGFSASLNAAGDGLAVGAYSDAGAGNGSENAGAVYLFTFTDDAFSGGRLTATMGSGYTGDPDTDTEDMEVDAGGGDLDVAALEEDDGFGVSVALNGTGERLAIGAFGDDGPGDGTWNAGAVYLFTFTDGAFSGGRLAAVVGKGYTGGWNVDVSALERSDTFGRSVSLNAAGDGLAVGASGDGGARNGAETTGAVYLFEFSDDTFSGGRLVAVVGKGYTGGGNVDVAALEARDYFGESVSLNGLGTRLAVGAWGDDGAGNGAPDAGAVYLFTFTDDAFSDGRLVAVVGKGYTGGRNIDVAALEENDRFGTSVSLNGMGERLAVGAYGDDGAGNGTGWAGAVYLFTFTDGAFFGGLSAAVVGKGYTGGGNVDVAALGRGDAFGVSVSLDAAGDGLAVGAGGDDGAGNRAPGTGAVYLFTFTGGSFFGGRLAAVMGKGYAGGHNVDVTALDQDDLFGHSVSLNAAGDSLAVGASRDEGAGNGTAGAGAVYLFTFTDDAFSGGRLVATVGKGYTGGQGKDTDDSEVDAGVADMDVAALEEHDGFGASVSLNAAGDGLAVGAWGDDGAGNGTDSVGAVYLFTFTDGAFSGGRLAAVMGKGYMGGGNVDVPALERRDYFDSVSLNAAGDRLAVGASGDDGAGNGTDSVGAVYLFTFTDGAFSGGRLAAVVGKGYTGGGNLDVAALESGDRFGTSVSLNGTGERLAVGALGDDGAGNRTGAAGAVYLFTFTGDAFAGGRLAAAVGKGYTGGGNVDVIALEKDDWFGRSVSLNSEGERLVVGAAGDDGAGNATKDTGAVYLFTFTDGAFSGGRLAAVLGKGYPGGANVDVAALEKYDVLGVSVSLNGSGTRLAVGAVGDDGAGNGTGAAGAVYLFTFTDGAFSDGRLAAVLGKGYTGGGNVDVTALEKDDAFGVSVSLNGSGTRLAVGAVGDDGAGNGTDGAGAVYLFAFTDGAFSGGRLAATVGNGYTVGQDVDTDDQQADTGGGDVDVATLERYDWFGISVSLNATGDPPRGRGVGRRRRRQRDGWRWRGVPVHVHRRRVLRRSAGGGVGQGLHRRAQGRYRRFGGVRQVRHLGVAERGGQPACGGGVGRRRRQRRGARYRSSVPVHLHRRFLLWRTVGRCRG